MRVRVALTAAGYVVVAALAVDALIIWAVIKGAASTVH